MGTRREHIYAVKNIINNGPASDDNRLSDRLIGHMLNTSRSVLLKRKMDKERTANESNYQVICVPLVSASYADCPNCNLPNLPCTLMKSTISIPKTILTRWGMSYRIRKIDGTIIPSFNTTNLKYSSFSLGSKSSIGWLMQGSTLIIVGPTHIPLVLVEGVFENPEEISSLDPCANPLDVNTSPCSMLDEDFPIDPDLVLPMYELTIRLLGYANTVLEDKVNDSSTPNGIQRQRVPNNSEGE